MHNDSEPAKWDKQQRDLGASFLQSALWGQFQTAIGHRAHFVPGEGWSCLLLERRAPLGRYLFAPYGPTVTTAQPAAVFKALQEYGRSNKIDWLRLEPIFKNYEFSRQPGALEAGGARRAPKDVEPHLTRIVDLTRPADGILSSLSQTTRNIIRRSQRQPALAFRTSRDPADMPIFTDMLAAVADRKSVGFFANDYYHQQAQILMPAGMMVLELAYDSGRPVGAAVIHDFARSASYTYAASAPEARDKNVSALLLWEAMMNAKQRGNQNIDLFGIAPENAGPQHPWYGFSSFKKKFGGEIIERSGTWDFPLTPKYRLYRSAISARRLLRV